MAAHTPAPRRRIRPALRPEPEAPPRRRRLDPNATGVPLFEEPYDGLPVEEIAPPEPQPGQAPTRRLSLRQRIEAIEGKTREEAEDLFYSTLHQFVLAKTPPDIICARMGISLNSLGKAKAVLNERIRAAAKARDPYDYIGAMLADIEEAKAVAWREVALAKAPEWTRRMRAIDSVLRANTDMGKLLQLAGMFDNQPMRQPLSNGDEDDGGANVLKELAANFLTGGYQANAAYRKSMTPADRVADEDEEA